MAKLTNKQKRFCEEYIIDWNATQAAIRAGYSEKTARQIADETLSKPYIKAHIEEIQKDLKKLAEFSALQAVNIYIGIANDRNAKDSDRINATKEIVLFLGLKGHTEETKDEATESDNLPPVNIFRKRRDNDKE